MAHGHHSWQVRQQLLGSTLHGGKAHTYSHTCCASDVWTDRMAGHLLPDHLWGHAAALESDFTCLHADMLCVMLFKPFQDKPPVHNPPRVGGCACLCSSTVTSAGDTHRIDPAQFYAWYARQQTLNTARNHRIKCRLGRQVMQQDCKDSRGRSWR